MTEYLGEPHLALVDHVLAQVNRRTTPAGLVAGLNLALDREAEGFVVKLRRMLAFESERVRILSAEQ